MSLANVATLARWRGESGLTGLPKAFRFQWGHHTILTTSYIQRPNRSEENRHFGASCPWLSPAGHRHFQTKGEKSTLITWLLASSVISYKAAHGQLFQTSCLISIRPFLLVSGYFPKWWCRATYLNVLTWERATWAPGMQDRTSTILSVRRCILICEQNQSYC